MTERTAWDLPYYCAFMSQWREPLRQEPSRMFKNNLILGLLALALFANAQYRGWDLFESTASAIPRQAGGIGRTYHK